LVSYVENSKTYKSMSQKNESTHATRVINKRLNIVVVRFNRHMTSYIILFYYNVRHILKMSEDAHGS
jgi:very-short-patch-repair endonuclease